VPQEAPMFLADRYLKERRDYIRMNVSCDIKCKEINTKELFSGKGINLSSRGLLFETSHQPPKPGTEVEIQIPSAGDSIPPLTARGTIIRSKPMDESVYEISMKINEMLN
jgi:hypothetical protein